MYSHKSLINRPHVAACSLTIPVHPRGQTNEAAQEVPWKTQGLTRCASSKVQKGSASSRTPGMPNVAVRDPSASTNQSYSTAPPSASTTRPPAYLRTSNFVSLYNSAQSCHLLHKLYKRAFGLQIRNEDQPVLRRHVQHRTRTSVLTI